MRNHIDARTETAKGTRERWTRIGRALVLFLVAGSAAAWSGAALAGDAGSADGRGEILDVATIDAAGGAPVGLRVGDPESGIVLSRRRIVDVFVAAVHDFSALRRRWVVLMPLPALPGPCFLDAGVRRRVLLALAGSEG